ncbi:MULTISPECIES: ECs1072 family phage-associated protein [unclassified Serratia (in: enterobacteria)]|uniref:ECs1072 family phage-associated protein n=1 Tax=unclassified Serratia (in: enterobacteria) TaxID=2647522 RepID=UPI0030762F23
MEISKTQYLNLFRKTFDGIPKSHKIGVSDNAINYFSHRALIIFRLDMLLFKYKQDNDPLRLILSGKNALTSYLINKKNIPLNDAKNASLRDALTILWTDIKSVSIPDSLLDSLMEAYSYNFNKFNPRYYAEQHLDYVDDEWNPELWDKLLLQ